MKAKDLLKMTSPFIFVTGPAGSGKTFLVREAINLSSKWGVLSATTGVAALVLGTDVIGGDVKTVHSTVGFFDADSLKNAVAFDPDTIRNVTRYSFLGYSV